MSSAAFFVLPMSSFLTPLGYLDILTKTAWWFGNLVNG
jgi:hypothetical protein